MNLSICIPTFRRAQMLNQLLKSIEQNKTLKDEFEIIIVDSGLSFDNTEDVVLKYKNLHIKYIKKDQDNGLDKVVKEMITIANGKYVWFISDDDIVLDGAIEHIQSIINKYGDLGGIVLNYKAFTNDLSKSFPPHDAFNGKPESELTFFKDNSQLFKKVGLHMGYLSCLILNTDHAQDILLKQNIKIPENLWGHTIIAGYISMINSNWIFSDFKSIGYRADSDSILKSIGLIERQKVTHVNFFDVISLIFGTNSVEERNIRTQLISKRVPRSILNMKTKNFSLVDQFRVFSLLFRHYKTYFSFWFLAFPSFFIPKFFLIFVKNIYLRVFSNKIGN